jgi:hypothetical protein
MNQYFEISRFNLLVKRIWVENYRFFFMAFSIMIGLGITFYRLSFNTYTGIVGNVQESYFVVGFLIGGTLFANYIFKDFSQSNQTLSYLLLPASHIEKLLSGLFYVFVLFPIIYTLAFLLVDYVFISYAESVRLSISQGSNKQMVTEVNRFLIERVSGKSSVHFPNKMLGVGLIANLYAFAVLGAIFYTRMSYVKTFFTGFAILVCIGLLSYILHKLCITNLEDRSDFINLSKENYANLLPTTSFLLEATFIGITYFLTPFLIIVSYFKLKEKEV